jgi:predicted anti-sigma-YlaC factor YlaD
MPLPTCRDMSELATDYTERALPWRVFLGAWWHLRHCAMCRAYYDQLAKLRGLLGRTRLPEPSAETEAAVLAARPHDGEAAP